MLCVNILLNRFSLNRVLTQSFFFHPFHESETTKVIHSCKLVNGFLLLLPVSLVSETHLFSGLSRVSNSVCVCVCVCVLFTMLRFTTVSHACSCVCTCVCVQATQALRGEWSACSWPD